MKQSTLSKKPALKKVKAHPKLTVYLEPVKVLIRMENTTYMRGIKLMNKEGNTMTENINTALLKSLKKHKITVNPKKAKLDKTGFQGLTYRDSISILVRFEKVTIDRGILLQNKLEFTFTRIVNEAFLEYLTEKKIK